MPDARERSLEFAYERNESLQTIADLYFNVEIRQPESLQSNADFYLNVII